LPPRDWLAGRRTALAAGLVLAAVASSGFYLLRARGHFGLGFPLDDAWIHQTYARNLAERGEWAFQTGQPSAGSTSPLWGGLLALGRAIGIDPLLWTYLIGVGLLALTAYRVASWVGFTHGVGRWWPIAAGALAVFEWHLVWAGLSGMEILALGLLALVTLQEAERGRWASIALGALIGLGVWLRPEALLLALPVGWRLGWRSPRRLLSQAGAAGLGLAVLLAAYAGFNYSLSGHWLPNTWYAKSAEYAILREIPLLVRLAAQLGIPGEALGQPGLAAGGPLVGALALLLPGMALAIRGRFGRAGAAGLAPVIWALAHLGAYAFRLPATYQHGRYAMPAIPVMLALGAEGMAGWCARRHGDLLRRILARAWPISLGLVAGSFWVLGANAYAQDVAIIETEMVTAARWVARNTAVDALVAAHDIGALGYFGERGLLDLAGLVSPDVIGILRDEQALAARLDAAGADYLVSFPGWYPQLTQGLAQAFNTRGRFSPPAGGENMVVYRWRSASIAP
jgi:hypothetical protein